MKTTLLRYHVLIRREGKQYIAYTPVFDLSTSGKTYDQAKKRFGELVHLFLEGLAENNTLERALKDLGWTKVKQEWQTPIIVGQEAKLIQLPA